MYNSRERFAETAPINIANAPEAVNFMQTEGAEDLGGVITSKPIYNYDLIKDRNLRGQVSQDAFYSCSS